MVTSLRTAAMGVLLIHLHIEMGASVWEQFPQLQTLPEEALACFLAAQCLCEGSTAATLNVLVEHFEQLLQVYRQCRHTFHVFAANVEPHVDGSGIPAILTALSSDRWPTFREMFPGVKLDGLDQYGPAVTVERPGQHIAMINRCLSNRDATFTGALQRFLGDGFADAWWLFESLSTECKQAELALTASTRGLRVDDLIGCLSSCSASPSASQECEAPAAVMVDVSAAMRQVCQLSLAHFRYRLDLWSSCASYSPLAGGTGAAGVTHIDRRAVDGGWSRLTGRRRVPQSAVESDGRRKVARNSRLRL